MKSEKKPMIPKKLINVINSNKQSHINVTNSNNLSGANSHNKTFNLQLFLNEKCIFFINSQF